MDKTCHICHTKDIIISKNPQGKLLYCTCPFCQNKVATDIYQGKITCPACQKQVKWQES